MKQAPAKKSDLGTRTLSALVMVAVAGTALWLGGWWWTGFAFLIGLGVLREWIALSNAFAGSTAARLGWVLGGAVYCGLATTVLIVLRDGPNAFPVLTVVAAVVATDVGAYFAGRTFGGPKIAPKISPSKTWSGLVGGMAGASVALLVCVQWGLRLDWSASLPWLAIAGPLVAVIAQTGDFFESWMKRRAGVKDSGHLIPGHGGLFDRTDGLIAVCFGIGLYMVAIIASTFLSGGSLLPSPA